MDMEFDGINEKDAVQKAIDELKIQDFEYEVISETKRGLFKKPCVRIRVILEDKDNGKIKERADEDLDRDDDENFTLSSNGEPENDIEKDIFSFINTLSDKMNILFNPEIVSRGDKGKINVNLKTDEGSYVIGYKGERLDAIQIITSAYILKKYSEENVRVILDVDGYRKNKIDKILLDSIQQAKKVKSSGNSIFLEPLNSYERREVHKAISALGGLDTESYGNGLLKRIKIFKIS